MNQPRAKSASYPRALVELTGRDHDLINHATAVPDERGERMVRLLGHTWLGDVTARTTG
jgi:hypothetical protein